MKMSKERHDEIINEVYENYLKTHKNEIFIMLDEMDLSKEDFIKKITNNYAFGFMFGITLNEQVYNDKEIPTKRITLEYNGEKIEIYEFL